MMQIITGSISLGLLWSIMTIGVYITFRILDIADMAVEGTIAMGAAIAAQAIINGMNPYAATALAMMGGMLAGLATGLLHTKLKIPALLSGILTMIALYSINLKILGKANLSLLRADNVFTVFENLGLSAANATIVIGLICAIITVIILYWFFKTELGCSVRACGKNPGMTRAQGVNTNNMIILGLVISNALVAVSGALIAQNQCFADIQMGIGSIVIGLASVIIGEVLYSRQHLMSKLIALVLGAVTYRIIIALVLKMGMSPNNLKLFTAVTVAIALALPVIKTKLHPIKISLEEDV